MYGVTESFIEALHAPFQRVAVRVRTTGGVPLEISDGSVDMDGRRAVQRSCSLTLTRTDDLTLADVYALLMSPDTELLVERGLGKREVTVVPGSTNYLINSYGAVNDGTRWAGWTYEATTVGTPTYSLVPGVAGNTAQRVQYTGVSGDAYKAIRVFTRTAAGSFAPGEYATGSASVKADVLADFSLTLDLRALDASGTLLDTYGGENATVSAEFVPLQVTSGPLPAGTSMVELVVLVMAGYHTPDEVDMTFDAAQIEHDTAVTPHIPTTTEAVTREEAVTVTETAEYVPLGVFSTDTASLALDAAGAVAWKGSDRSNKIRRARFIDPYSIASGTPLADAAAAVLTDRYPGVLCEFGNVTETINTNVIFQAGPDSDPWKDLRSLFFNYGYDLHFNGSGACVAVLLEQSQAAFTFGQGETSLMLGGEVAGALDRVYNGVIATGEGPDMNAPVRAIVWDSRESSPTYYLGAYGKVPYFYTSPLLATRAQCQVAASAILARVRGGEQVLSWPAIVNPALEPNDMVEVYVNDVPATYTLDRITIPLHASGTMDAVAREGVVTW